jgi:hypothetical protein
MGSPGGQGRNGRLSTGVLERVLDITLLVLMRSD